jgi:MFS family permease
MTTTAQTVSGPAWRTPLVVIIAGCTIAMLGFGPRSIMGLFLEPMTVARGWDRETFALAMAMQNLMWGLGAPVAGGLADRFGPVRVLLVGALVYAVGIVGMAYAESGLGLFLTGGILVGLGVAFTAFGLVISAMARVVGPERRSLIFGLGTAAGSMGQVVFSPIGQGFIGAFGWQHALLLVAAIALVVAPLALVLSNDTSVKGEAHSDQTISQAIREAASHRGFVLLTLGFFVCGFHVAFITVHFPAYVADLGLDPRIGAISLSLIGFFNICGSFLSGMFGQCWSKKCGLSFIYFARACAITALLLAPKTELTILLFAGTMGILWLSTVPLTSGIVAQVFGLRYMATLFGFVFFSHQVGSFLGVWLGGRLYDTTGSYDGIWWAGVGFGLAAAIVHLPINENPLPRLMRPRPSLQSAE